MSSKRTLGLAVCLLITLALAGCYPNPSPAGLTPIPTLAPGTTLTPAGGGASATQPASGTPVAANVGGGNAASGQPLFATNCSPCHGQNGQGGGVGPKLAGDPFIKSGDQAVFSTIANGRPGTAMPAWSKAKGGALSDAQINDLIAYLKTLQ